MAQEFGTPAQVRECANGEIEYIHGLKGSMFSRMEILNATPLAKTCFLEIRNIPHSVIDPLNMFGLPRDYQNLTEKYRVLATKN